MFFSLNKVEDHPLSQFQNVIRQFFEQCTTVDNLDWSLFPNWFQRILDRFGATRNRFEQVFNIIKNYDSEKKRKVLEIFDMTNDIEELCNNKELIPGFIEDTSANLNTIKTLFEKLFDETFKETDLFEGIEDCSLNSHYQKFRELNKVCPFCGIESYSDRGVKPRENYDHYLHESEYFLAGANFDNLIPMCHKCNSRGNKGSKDVLFEYEGSRKTNRRRLAYYPYSTVRGVTIEISYIRDFEFDVIERFETILIANEVGENEQVKTWDEVFNITERLNARIREEQKTWIEELIQTKFSMNSCSEEELRKASEDRANQLSAKIKNKREAVLESAFMKFLANTEEEYLLSGYCGVAKSAFAVELDRRKKNLYS